MNSYQLISKLRKVRDDTYLTTASQALYHELVAICNEMKWKDVFFVRSNVLCGNLDMSDNTLRKSRSSLAASGLIYYETSKDKRIGCYYSFVKKLSNDIVSSAESSAISSLKTADDIADHIKDEDIDNREGRFINDIPGSSSISSAESPAKIADDKKDTSSISSANFEYETEIPPIIDIKTINKGESLAHTHESPPPKKAKSSRKKEGDEKPLVFPFTSLRFMSTWEALRNTPKWKKKMNLALQMSLNKLGKFEEEFAIELMDRAIESDWTGVVFPGTEQKYKEWLNRKHGNNRKLVSKSEEESAGIKSITFGG
ncbi:hypothetical protein AAE250_20635 [Bacteroides sp. GD17]|jgi:hypothetical protein|uniref:hypothetical protein n=1 Tax=Bacteroides sp. GD17 TaxID=3139826 RepID=UPI0025D8125E|nr:hypothetical protein [uncultured Bacteroides sp.]